MKTEEIKPGDILHDKERKLLVKVARVDEDGVVKYSAYTDMHKIFQTVPPPYRVGTRTAEAYIPATDEQRKYMERELAVCEYVNLPKNNSMEVLAYIIADLKAENMKLEQRVHQLMDDFYDVTRQLRGMEKCKDEDSSRQTLGEMMQMRDHCDKLEKENEELKRQCFQLQAERNGAKTHAAECNYQKEGLHKRLARFEQLEFVKTGAPCVHLPFAPDGSPVQVGSAECVACRHFLNMEKSFCVLCACRYDNKEDKNAQECKDTDD